MTVWTYIGIVLGLISIGINLVQSYNRSRTKVVSRTTLSLIRKHGKRIESTFPNIEEAAGVELASGLATIKSEAVAIVNHIDEFRRFHWKENPPSSVE